MQRRSVAGDLIPIDWEINATYRRRNSERIIKFLQDLDAAATPKLTITLIFFFVLFLTALGNTNTNTVGSELLKVAPSEFAGTVRTVVDVLQDITSILSEFGSGFGDSRLSNAVSDCLELLDMSSDELDWSVSATQSPKGTNINFPVKN